MKKEKTHTKKAYLFGRNCEMKKEKTHTKIAYLFGRNCEMSVMNFTLFCRTS